MSPPTERTVVTVEIGGEHYNIRAQASPEYTKECAAYVDRKLTEIMQQGAIVQVHKAAILAALTLAGELFEARGELDVLRLDLTRRAGGLADQIDDALNAPDLAAGS